ncbi:MAG: SDR family oxidoreductase [Chloroflexi bacterium]|nr:SDR family oxidoreductase [Chloroflexota bacterium]
MAGRTCLITGATNGIGKETAIALAKMGASVVLVARDERKGRAAQSELKERSGADSELLLADLASLADVRRLAEEYRSRHDKLHVLINNAGAYNSKRELSKDGYEMTIAVNHLAHFLLTDLLLDVIKASAPARIINVSSGAHSGAKMDFDDLQAESGYGVGMRAYGQSKLANVLFTNELARRLEGANVAVNSLHPGVVRTGFGRNAKGIIGGVFAVFQFVGRPFLLSSAQGAETSIYLASSPDVETTTGEYFVKSKSVASNDESNDPEVARRLWDVSEELIKQAS